MLSNYKTTIKIASLILINFVLILFYNFYLVFIIVDSESIVLDLLRYNYFNFLPNLEFLNITLLIVWAAVLILLRKRLIKQLDKMKNTFKVFQKVIVPATLLSTIIFILSTVILNSKFYQKMFFFGGDYIVLIIVIFIVVMIFVKDESNDVFKIEYDDSDEAPIENPEQDVLGITEELSVILNYIQTRQKKKYASVYGIIGKRGSGKTSGMNLIKYFLNDESNSVNNRIIPIDINLSKYEKLNKLYIHLFDEIITEINDKFYTPRLEKNIMISAIVKKFIGDIDVETLLNGSISIPKLEKYYKTISEWLFKIDWTVVCFIDDIDRLKNKDIEKVLKFIIFVKNNLGNTILIVGADIGCFNDQSSFNEVVEKYFDHIYHMPSFDNKLSVTLISDILFGVLEKEQIGYSQSDLNRMLIEGNISLEQINSILTTYRKLKHFSVCYRKLINRVKLNVHWTDLIKIALIESVYPTLFSFIKTNSRKLVVDETNVEYLMNFEFTLEKDFSTYKRMYQDLIQSLTNEEVVFVYDLFPHIKLVVEMDGTDYQTYSKYGVKLIEICDDIQYKQRIAASEILPKILSDEEIETSILRYTSSTYKEEIIEYLLPENFNLEMMRDKINKIFPSGDDNRSIRNISANWINDIIMQLDIVSAGNLLKVLSFIALSLPDKLVGFLGRSEKKGLSFIVWKYYSRPNRDEEILIEIIKTVKNSDSFANTILFYSINDNRRPFRTEVSNELKTKICQSYLQRVKSKLTNSENIFDEDFFDQPLDLLYRWKQAQEYLTNNSADIPFKLNVTDYLMKIFESSPVNFYLYLSLSNLLHQDYDDEDPYLEMEIIEQLIPFDKFIHFVNGFLSKQDKYEKVIPKRFLEKLSKSYYNLINRRNNNRN